MSGDRVSRQRILVGGVPFGRDNVGDEAILECVVGIVRELAAEAEIWVSTDDQEAPASKLSVKTRPLFGFDPPGFSRDEMFSALEAVDVFIWSGATGLSDYPEIPLALLSRASERGKRTAIFCTGMNTELNPYLYTLLPGVRHKLFSAIKTASFGMIDLIARYESSKRKVAASEMRKGIQSADKVILRDAPSLESMEMLIGAPERAITIGADPAIEIQPKAVEVSGFKDDVKAVVREPCKKIGLCISAQSPVKQMKDVARVFDRLVADEGAKIVGIPMNPITDAKLMNEFRNELERPEAMVVAEGRFEPDEVTGLAAEMDVVISSRLHLLILATITMTPIIGISRGSKVTNFTSQFGLPDIGSVDALSVGLLENEIRRLFSDRPGFEAKAREVRVAMERRLAEAKSQLKETLS